MRVVIINSHHTYAGWSGGKPDHALMDLARVFR